MVMVSTVTDNKNPQTETLVIFSIGNHSIIVITVNTNATTAVTACIHNL